ncbi:DUF1735 domain-containing protein [Polaribacter sp. Hel1_85]|uniref:DUF1735 domain-containing protein n=1 Tax=Polaribacter sp. Hel1_85 TaxID=1250005 RepID=UPI00052C1806|nr:DUF1735 domain-containing protein [Polaribacter sp. Hel1_85]KGL58904.1 hypothetical protein PHEL85_3175 [Polaribacter sp. Hel1_85]
MDTKILKSITKIVALSFALLLTSCYEDAFQENFDYTSVYLAHETIDRTFIIGEGMQIGVGVTLGGTINNTKDIEVTFSLDDDLVTNAGKSVLLNNYYELVDSEGNPANNKIIIPAGKVQGFVYVKANEDEFLADSESLNHNYALGFTLESVINADIILTDPEDEESTKYKSSVISFSYINQLYGNYVQTGQYTTTIGGVDETSQYSGGITDVDALELTMISPTTVECNGVANLRNSDTKMNIVLGDDNTITLETAAGGVTIVDDGSTYNPETRELTLNYSFESDGISYKATDVLEFRNRVVDGVNQIGI